MMKMILVATLGCVLLVNCSKPIQEMPVIVVGGQNIYASEFSQRLIEKSQNFPPSQVKDPSTSESLKAQLVQELLVEGFLLEWAASEGALDISPKSIDDELKAIEKQYLHRKEFQTTLAKMKIPRVSLKKRAHALLIKKELLNRFSAIPSIDEKEIERLYWKDKNSFRDPAQVNLQQILVATELEATTLQQALKKSDAEFDQLAKTYSIAPEAQNGGHIGWISKGILPAFDAAFKRPKGRILAPQKSTYGYHIIKIVDKRKSRRRTLEEVKLQMSQKSVSDQKAKLYGQWLETQLHKFDVQINEQAIANAKIDVQRKKL